LRVGNPANSRQLLSRSRAPQPALRFWFARTANPSRARVHGAARTAISAQRVALRKIPGGTFTAGVRRSMCTCPRREPAAVRPELLQPGESMRSDTGGVPSGPSAAASVSIFDVAPSTTAVAPASAVAPSALAGAAGWAAKWVRKART